MTQPNLDSAFSFNSNFTSGNINSTNPSNISPTNTNSEVSFTNKLMSEKKILNLDDVYKNIFLNN
jgi:hypothetical protein